MTPVAWTTMPDADDWEFISGGKDPNGNMEGIWHPLYSADQLHEAKIKTLREAAERFVKGSPARNVLERMVELT